MIFHIVPLNDTKEHKESSTCSCEPEVKTVEGNMLVIHNAFDLREIVEEANEILKTYDKK